MSLFVFTVIIFFLTKKDQRKSDIFKAIFGIGIFFSVVSSIFDFTSVPGIVLFFILMACLRGRSGSTQGKKKKQKENRRQQADSAFNTAGRGATENSAYSGWEYRPEPQTGGKVRSQLLPRTVGKRTRVLEAFNKKYALTLSDEEMKRIVDASYMSEGWKRELEAMTAKYETIYEWFNSSTSWLRVYIYVFQIQNISSDFVRQEGICMETFDEVMRYAESLQYMTLDERITRVNDRFFTSFDETSFMIAYRFMQRKGKTYDLNKIDIVQNESEIERMAKKYETTGGVR